MMRVPSAPLSDDRDMSERGDTRSALSMDEVDAAAVLTELQRGTPLSPASSRPPLSPVPTISQQESQPLLTLLTSHHPFIASTINNSLTAYTTSKTNSASFRTVAESLERNIAQPVANTVGTASRMTGVEYGVRWWLNWRDSGTGTTNPSKAEPVSGQKQDSTSSDVVVRENSDPWVEVHRHRGFSEASQPESLPPYDDQRSPRYEEFATSQVGSPIVPSTTPGSLQQNNWQTRLAIHTSGLGVAMSDDSLRRLKFCLAWLRWANDRLSRALQSLQQLLTEWESSRDPAMGALEQESVPPRDPGAIANKAQILKDEVLSVLKRAVEIISSNTGGSLPANAGWFVKSQLMSLPARFTASKSQHIEIEGDHSIDIESQQRPQSMNNARTAAVLAREGLEMLRQITTVIDGTVMSAEDWLERLGRSRGGTTGPVTGDHDQKTALDSVETHNEDEMTGIEKTGL